MAKKTNTVPSKTWPTLYKHTVGEGTQEWNIAVEQQGNHGVLVIRYGLQNGKKQEQRDVVKQGKNLGKKNETSPYEQAVLEAEARFKKQIERKHYGLTVEESAGKRALAPMLALPYEKHAKKVDWGTTWAQPKLDGFRCLARREGNEITLTSREGKPITTMSHVVETLKFVMKDGDTFDGELYHHEMEFEQIASAIKKQKETSESIVYNVYDYVADRPFAERIRKIFGQLNRLGSGNAVVPVETNRVLGEDDLTELQRRYIDTGLEGAMLRHGDAGYEAGKRSATLLKVKTFKDAEFPVTGFRVGKGDIAIFVCKTADGHPFEVTAPGSLVEKRKYLQQAENYVGKMLTVKYQDFTATEQPVPRFPVAKAFRE